MLEAHARERVFVITAHGEWDLLTAPAMEQMLRTATSGKWPVVAVDLADVSFMDPAGCGPLRAAIRRCRQAEVELFLVHPRPLVAQVLRICGLGGTVVPVEVLPHRQEIEDLLTSADNGSAIIDSV
jgi:anti-sigma B factor antagonist